MGRNRSEIHISMQQGEEAPRTHLISSDRFSVQGPCHGDAACVLIDSESSFRVLIHSLPGEPELGPFGSVTIDYLFRENRMIFKTV